MVSGSLLGCGSSFGCCCCCCRLRPLWLVVALSPRSRRLAAASCDIVLPPPRVAVSAQPRFECCFFPLVAGALLPPALMLAVPLPLSLSLPLCCFLFLSLKRCKMLLHSWYAMLQKPPRSLLSMLLQCQEELSEEAGILSDEAYNVSSLMVCDVT